METSIQQPQNIDQLAEKVGGRFRLTRLIAERRRQVNSGAPLLVERREDESILCAICREVEKGLITIEVHEQPAVAEDTTLDLLSLGDDVADTE